MKTINKFLGLLLLSAIFISCKKEENKVFFQGGTAPALSASSTGAITLDRNRIAENAITFSWTNPNYMFNTGLSSQTVNYLIQVDKSGDNFSSSVMQEISVPGDLKKAFTVGELNTILNKMEMESGVAHALDLRIKSNLGASAAPLFSNVLNLTVTPYLDFAVQPPGTEAGGYLDADLWVLGDAFASGYTNPLPSPYDVSQKLTRVDLLHYEGIVQMVGGGAYKMIQKQGEWSTQYHALTGATWDAGSFEKRDADPGFPGAPTAGTYKISVNFQTGRYSVVKQ